MMPNDVSAISPDARGPRACPTENAAVSAAMPVVNEAAGRNRFAATVAAVGPAMKPAPNTIADTNAAAAPGQIRTGITPAITTTVTRAGATVELRRAMTLP